MECSPFEGKGNEMNIRDQIYRGALLLLPRLLLVVGSGLILCACLPGANKGEDPCDHRARWNSMRGRVFQWINCDMLPSFFLVAKYREKDYQTSEIMLNIRGWSSPVFRCHWDWAVSGMGMHWIPNNKGLSILTFIAECFITTNSNKMALFGFFYFMVIISWGNEQCDDNDNDRIRRITIHYNPRVIKV